MPAFDILIDENGKATIRASGFKGKACLEEADKLTQLLKAAGIETKVERLTLTEEAQTATTTEAKTGA